MTSMQMDARTDAMPRAPIMADHPWHTIADKGTSCLVLPPVTQNLSEPVSEIMAGGDINMRVMGDLPGLSATLTAQLPTSLAAFILRLAKTYEAFMGGRVIRVRLETIRSKACWKWHRDYTTLRLITTLRGAGTQFLPDPADPEDIVQIAEGEIGLFKGRLFGAHVGEEGHQACVHRSPPFDAQAAPRLLLVIDTPQDFEIEDARDVNGVIEES